MVQLTVTVAKNYTNVKLPGQQHAIELINLMHRGQIGAPDLDPCHTGLSSAMSFSGLCKERETFTSSLGPQCNKVAVCRIKKGVIFQSSLK